MLSNPAIEQDFRVNMDNAELLISQIPKQQSCILISKDSKEGTCVCHF